MIFGINTTSDISKLLDIISRAVRRVKLRQFWNITRGIYAKYYVQIMLLFVYTTTCKGFVIFTCRYFKLSWNITALSQLNCSNFLCSSIKPVTPHSFRTMPIISSRRETCAVVWKVVLQRNFFHEKDPITSVKKGGFPRKVSCLLLIYCLKFNWGALHVKWRLTGTCYAICNCFFNIYLFCLKKQQQ